MCNHAQSQPSGQDRQAYAHIEGNALVIISTQFDITYYFKSLTPRVTQSARCVEEALKKGASRTEILLLVYRHQSPGL